MALLADDLNKSIDSLRVLIYGPAKSRKTLWAGTAAEAGFNVLLLDCDDGYKILSHLTPEAKKRIYRLNIVDTMKSARASKFMSLFCKYPTFAFDEEQYKLVLSPTAKVVEERGEHMIQIDPERLAGNTIIVLDSYTALVESIARQFSIDNDIDLSDADKPEWDGYAWCGRLATWMLGQLKVRGLPLIMISHQEVYEKIKKKAGKVKRQSRDQEIEFIRLQPKSTSQPHSMTVANKFDEILYFRLQGEKTMIDVQADTDRDSGGRILTPGTRRFDDFKFIDLCKEAKIVPPKNAPLISELLECRVKESKLTQSKTEIVKPKQPAGGTPTKHKSLV